MKKVAKLVSFIAGLTLVFTAIMPVNALYAPPGTLVCDTNHPIYVDKANGNDTDPGITPGEALKTITEAVDRANTGGWSDYQILVTNGDYTAETFPWVFNKDITICGGYYSGFSTRDSLNNPTSIRASSDTVIQMTNKSGTLSGFKIYNQTSGDATIYIDNTGADNDNVIINSLEIDNVIATFGGIYALLESGDELSVHNNYIHNLSSLGSAIYVEGTHSLARIYQNFLFGNSLAFAGAVNGENSLIYNNIISDTTGVGLILDNNSKAYHNTVVNNGTGIRVPASSANAEFMNNLSAYNSGAGADISSGSATYDYNAYHNNGSSHTLGTNEVNCDPMLNNINSTNPNDYMLDDTSLCIDTGTEVVDVSTDYFHSTRKMDGNIDAVYASDPGAHEVDGDIAMGPLIINVQVSPNIFSPDFDGINDTATISFDSYATSNISITIIDGSNIVKELMNEVKTSGTYNVVWDGTDSNGDPVAEKMYEFAIIANNSEGNIIITGNITVDFDASQQNCAGFIDVPVNDPLCPALQYVRDEGIFQGYPDGTFRPNTVINRVESTKVILEGFNIPLLSDDGTNLGFPDVIIGEWYMTYLRSAQAEGIVQGYPDGTFRPNQQVVRVELLKIFFETSAEDLSGVTITTPPYPDTPLTADTSWYMVYVQFSKDHALVDADPQGNFNPAEGMKRGDVAELFYRFHQEGFI